MRLFIAVAVPDKIKTSLFQFIDSRQTISGIRWSGPDAYHLTLKFLGEVDPESLPALQAALQGLSCGDDSISLRLRSGGVFPSERKPRVFWAGVEGEAGKLAHLAQEADAALQSLGFPVEERAYHPHLTVGRARKECAPQDLVKAARQFCTLLSDFHSEEFVAKEFSLIRSHLHSNGVRYEHMAAFSLRRS